MKKSLVILFLISISLTSLLLYSCKKKQDTFTITTPVNSAEFSITVEDGGQRVKDGEFSATAGNNVKFKLTLHEKYNRNAVVVKNKDKQLTLSHDSSPNITYFTLSNISENAEITVEDLKVKKITIFVAYQKSADGTLLNANQDYLLLGLKNPEGAFVYNSVSTAIQYANQRRIEVDYGETFSMYVKTTKAQTFAIDTLELSYSTDDYSGTEQSGTIPTMTFSDTEQRDEYLFSLPNVTKSTTIYIDSTNMQKAQHEVLTLRGNKTISIQTSKSTKTWGESFSFSVAKLLPDKPAIYENMEVWVNDRKITPVNGQYTIGSDVTPDDVTDDNSEFDDTAFRVHIKELKLEYDNTQSVVNIRTFSWPGDVDVDIDKSLNTPDVIQGNDNDVFIFKSNSSTDIEIARYQFFVEYKYQPDSKLRFSYMGNSGWHDSAELDLNYDNASDWTFNFYVYMSREEQEDGYLYTIRIEERLNTTESKDINSYLYLPSFTLRAQSFMVYNPNQLLYNMFIYTASDPTPILVTNKTSQEANQSQFKVLWMDTLYIEIQRKPGHTRSLLNDNVLFSHYSSPSPEIYSDKHGVYKKLYSIEVDVIDRWTTIGIWGASGA